MLAKGAGLSTSLMCSSSPIDQVGFFFPAPFSTHHMHMCAEQRQIPDPLGYNVQLDCRIDLKLLKSNSKLKPVITQFFLLIIDEK